MANKKPQEDNRDIFEKAFDTPAPDILIGAGGGAVLGRLLGRASAGSAYKHAARGEERSRNIISHVYGNTSSANAQKFAGRIGGQVMGATGALAGLDGGARRVKKQRRK